MSYDLLILAFLILVFCFFTMTLTVNIMFSLFNSVRPEGTEEIKPFIRREKPKKKSRLEREIEEKARIEREQWDTLMHNINVYDGTEIGQKEVK